MVKLMDLDVKVIAIAIKLKMKLQLLIIELINSSFVIDFILVFNFLVSLRNKLNKN